MPGIGGMKERHLESAPLRSVGDWRSRQKECEVAVLAPPTLDQTLGPLQRYLAMCQGWDDKQGSQAAAMVEHGKWTVTPIQPLVQLVEP